VRSLPRAELKRFGVGDKLAHQVLVAELEAQLCGAQ